MKRAPLQLWYDPKDKKEYIVRADRRNIDGKSEGAIMGYFYKCGDEETWHPRPPKDLGYRFVKALEANQL